MMTTIVYTMNNLKTGGQVYILGGTGSVPPEIEKGLQSAGFKVKRLGGGNRYGTNLLVLGEAKLKPGQEFIVTTGAEFGDALSASASGKPILLVGGNGLTIEQKSYLNKVKPSRFTIVGDTNLVSEGVQKDLNSFATTSRIVGRTVYNRSVNIAKKYFPGNQPHINLALGDNFPDGLCGGPLVRELGGPLLLVNNQENGYSAACTYAQAARAFRATALGGTGSISDATVKKILQMK